MKIQNTAQRLQQLMFERKLKQVDIIKIAKPYCDKFNIKLNKNDLSQYVSGKVEPGQNKLLILGLALNVSEAWLMGFDVPMERNNISPIELLDKTSSTFNSSFPVSKHEKNLVIAYRNKPEMQSAVDKLLNLQCEDYCHIYRAARSENNHEHTIELRSNKDLDKIRNAKTVTSDNDL